MAKLKKEIIEERKDFMTIGEYFKDVLENKECRIIKCVFYGNLTASSGTGKNKKPCRVSIALPKEICDNNLKALDDWFLTIVAIPRKTINKLKENEVKENGKETEKNN